MKIINKQLYDNFKLYFKNNPKIRVWRDEFIIKNYVIYILFKINPQKTSVTIDIDCG